MNIKTITLVKKYFLKNPEETITPTNLANALGINHYAAKNAISYLEGEGFLEVHNRGIVQDVKKAKLVRGDKL